MTDDEIKSSVNFQARVDGIREFRRHLRSFKNKKYDVNSNGMFEAEVVTLAEKAAMHIGFPKYEKYSYDYIQNALIGSSTSPDNRYRDFERNRELYIDIFDTAVEEALKKLFSEASLLEGVDALLDVRSQLKQLYLMSVSLQALATTELQRLEDDRPNDFEAIEQRDRQVEIVSILLTGFEKLSISLKNASEGVPASNNVPTPRAVAQEFGEEIQNWWKFNKTDAVNISAKSGLLAGGVALANLAGANMTVATTAIVAWVGGAQVANLLTAKKDKNKK